MHDLVIRGARIVDGTGAPACEGDVAVEGGRIAAVGRVDGRGRREIAAGGDLLTPGFVDIHTHYDAQATWDPDLAPSSWHGVTTAVMGNCGVGFAPARPDRHDWLIGLMEGVEDIPGAALTAGIAWGWESFPEYLDALAAMPRAIDVAAQVPHGAVRAYVMGERGARNEPADADDVAAMARIVREGVAAGALGFSTSRTFLHKSVDGEYVPGTFADEAELFGIGRAMAAAPASRRPVFQMTSNHRDMPREFDWMRRLAAETGIHVVFNLVQTDEAPDTWAEMLRLLDGAAADDVPVFAQVAGRPAGILMGWEATIHPFSLHEAWAPLAALDPRTRLARLAEPATRAALLAPSSRALSRFEAFVTRSFTKMFPLGPAPDYEPAPEASVAARAARLGRSAAEVAYDSMMEDDGRGLIYFPLFNYTGGDMAPIAEMLAHPRTRLGLGDGGAHCGTICDASIPTYMLTHWTRDRARGPRLPLEMVVAKQTSGTAALYGLGDRGLIAPGMLADLNLIDAERLAVEAPRMVHDLPAGARRLVQGARGYRATIKSGIVIAEEGEMTGARPGVLLRGPRRA